MSNVNPPRPENIGVDVGVKIATLIEPEQGRLFVELATDHRPVPVSVLVDGNWTSPHQECGAHGCGQIWPCATRRSLDIVEALIAHIP